MWVAPEVGTTLDVVLSHATDPDELSDIAEAGLEAAWGSPKHWQQEL